VQVNLHGLPADVVVKCISDFVEVRQAPDRPVNNYEDWLLSSFGKTFAELFPMQYTRKYHTTTADNMSTDWLGPRIYRPSLEEVLCGALSHSAPDVHYIKHFRYPKNDGFVSYLTKFVPMGNLKLNHKVVSIDPHARELCFSNGLSTNYDGLITSIPLPELIRMLGGTPQHVVEASKRLACSTVVLVNVGINREDISRSTLTYIYDEDICFTRLGYPHMLSATNVPRGTGSIQAEVYFSEKYRPLTGPPEAWIEPVIRDIRRIGVMKDDDRVLFSKAMMLRYANIIFDLDRAAALKTVHSYLDEFGIGYCGRYGDWGYMWTDESFKSGENAAQRVLERATQASPAFRS
jgi:protoporphyrinogen oxidase